MHCCTCYPLASCLSLALLYAFPSIQQLQEAMGRCVHLHRFLCSVYGGVFTVGVFDNAHEFPIPILAKLGERGNSTNYSGNGYAEIFEFLAESGASLVIIEQLADNIPAKTVQVMFDGREDVVIRTAYRFEELKTALDGTRFIAERLG